MSKKIIKTAVLGLLATMTLGACQGGGESNSTSTSNSSSLSQPSNSTSSSVSNAPRIASVSKKRSFVNWAFNRSEKENKHTEFYDREQNYSVGTLNSFNVKPFVVFVDNEGDPINVSTWEYEIELYLKENDAYQKVALDDYLDSYDVYSCDIDFKDIAIDKEFKVVVTPTGLSENQLANKPRYQMTFEFQVVEGLNVYNALDLSYINNQKTDTKEGKAWSDFRKEHNIDEDLSPTQYIFHDDIEITREVLPSIYFFNEGDSDLNTSDSDYQRALGSLRDFIYPYYHSFKNDDTQESLKFLGNYFAFDASKIPFVVRERNEITSEGEVTSHSALFYFYADKQYQENKLLEMRDINFIGNAPKVEDTVKSGGVIAHKSVAKTRMINNISNSWFITYFNNGSVVEYLIEKCKAYDNFNSFIYSWGGKTKISGSEMIGAGGPIIIQDHTRLGKPDEQIPVTIVEDSNLENYVAGTEGWFNLVGASALAPQIKGLNAIFEPFGKSFLKPNSKDPNVTMFNLLCVNKDGSAESITSTTIKGRFVIDDNPYFDYGNYDSDSNQVLGYFIQTVTSQTGGTAPIFQSCGENGFAYFNGQSLVDATNTPITDPQHDMFKGDYLSLYYSGMLLSFGYFDLN